jgi:hypothetical protein
MSTKQFILESRVSGAMNVDLLIVLILALIAKKSHTCWLAKKSFTSRDLLYQK